MTAHCHYCKKILGAADPITKDHVVPRGRGGMDIRWNIVPACRTCNGLKSDKWPTCPCSFCTRTRRRHWERFGIRESSRTLGWVKVSKYEELFRENRQPR